MSENHHDLILTFKNESQHKSAVLMFMKLCKDERQQAEHWASKLGVALNDVWDNDWFNQTFSASPDYIRVSFESSTSVTCPLTMLQTLFNGGLQSAVVDVFNNQVGEGFRYHFHNNQLLNPEDLYSLIPSAENIILDTLGEQSEFEAIRVSSPKSIRKILADDKHRQEEAMNMVSAIVELSKHSRSTGQNLEEAAQSLMVTGILIQSIKEAVIYTVATVLLFKGIWLWICTGILYAIAAPILRTNALISEARDEDTANDGDSSDDSEQQMTAKS